MSAFQSKIWRESICVDWFILFEGLKSKKEVIYLIAPIKKGHTYTRLKIALTERVDPGLVTITLYSCHNNMNDNILANH